MSLIVKSRSKPVQMDLASIVIADEKKSQDMYKYKHLTFIQIQTLKQKL